MESFLLLHGIGNHRPPQHWQFLLAAALVERGHDVHYPQLPQTEKPDLDAWLDVLHMELAALSGTRHTVITHSLSGLLWMHAAHRGLAAPVDRVLIVAPPVSDRVPDDGAGFRLETPDVAAVRASATSELAFVTSDDDPYAPEGAAARYGEAIGVETIIVPGAAHFTPASGYGSWPRVLDWCLTAAG